MPPVDSRPRTIAVGRDIRAMIANVHGRVSGNVLQSLARAEAAD
jgi:hypothetical protein